MNIPKWLQSSQDPSQISLTVESFGKSAGALILLFATIKGIDPMIATQWWGAVVAQVTLAVSSGYAVYHAGVMLWGLMRKAIAFFGKPKVVAPSLTSGLTPGLTPADPIV